MAEDEKTLKRQIRRAGIRRGIVHKVKVSESQEARLQERAERNGWTISRLLVESALAGGAAEATARKELAGELFRTVRVLGKVGVNINQIAKATNATGQAPAGTEAALEAVERLCRRIEELRVRMERS